jgi:hypothetical protein
MQNKRPLVLDLDGTLTSQKTLMSRHSPEIIDLKDIAPLARFWMTDKTKAILKDRLRSRQKDAITFLGSGDFHHLANILIEDVLEPVTIIDFDYHPDWDILLPLLHCGSWVTRTLKQPNVNKVIELGPSSDDLSNIWIQTCAIDALKDNRLEIYPYSHRPTTTYFNRVPGNISINVHNTLLTSTITWNELKNKNLSEFLRHVLKRLPSENVYISIDKDCLMNDYSLTNWEEGRFSLDDLLLMLRVIKENSRIVGVDICGDYSKPVLSGLLKKVIVKMNHPKENRALTTPPNEVTRINEETNLRILELLG